MITNAEMLEQFIREKRKGNLTYFDQRSLDLLEEVHKEITAEGQPSATAAMTHLLAAFLMLGDIGYKKRFHDFAYQVWDRLGGSIVGVAGAYEGDIDYFHIDCITGRAFQRERPEEGTND